MSELIPKIIHYCWCGPNEMPEEDRKRIKRWKELCPDYKIIEWNENNYDFHKNNYMDEAYKAKKWGFVPDYARYDIVYQYGGIYLDTDVELLRNLDELLINKFFFGFESDEFVASGLGFGAEPYSKVVGQMRDLYNELFFLNDDGTINLIPSPRYTTKILQEAGFIMDGSIQYLDGGTIYPTEYFCPLNYITGELNVTPNTYAIHWYAASWLSALTKKRRNVSWFLNEHFGLKLGKLLYRVYLICSMIANGEFNKIGLKIVDIVQLKRKEMD